MGILKHKEHILMLTILFLVIIIAFHNYLDFTHLPLNDMTTGYMSRTETLRMSILEYNDWFPMWSPFTMSGTPCFAKADVQGFFYLINFLFQEFHLFSQQDCFLFL